MVIFHYLIKTQGTFCQQRVLIKNASGRLGMFFRESLLQKCIVVFISNKLRTCRLSVS